MTVRNSPSLIARERGLQAQDRSGRGVTKSLVMYIRDWL